MYSNFASIYDRLMQDIPYTGWIDYLRQLFDRHGLKPVEILDIGCGTGNVTIPLAEMGYRLTGLDMSPEMLAVAEEKARNRGLAINWLCQDMRDMNLGGIKFDVAISMTDSLNYLATPAELRQVFNQTARLLKHGGWLVFDLNSAYKLSEVFGDNVFTLLDEDIAYIWENTFDRESRTCFMDLTFFVREQDGRYRRFAEEHSETAYELEEVCALLKESGFSVEAVYAEGTYTKPDDRTERIYYVAQAKNKDC